MKFIDPLPITCDRCSAKLPQQVADLLSLRAICPSCGASLAEVGCEMRATIDEAAAFFKLVEIAAQLEDKLTITTSDAELQGAKTLRELAAIIQQRLPPSPEAEGRSLELITTAASKVTSCEAKEISLDTPIMDAVAPSRWTDTIVEPRIAPGDGI